MNEKELIKGLMYEGVDISKFQNSIQIVGTDDEKFVKSDEIIATSSTFSCCNMLIFSNNFSYLVHMLPSETIGVNNKIYERINNIINCISLININEIQILISLGSSNDKDSKVKFHDLTNVYEAIDRLSNYCQTRDIELSILPILRSKYLVFDNKNGDIYNELSKEPIKIENLDKSVYNKKGKRK